MALQQALDPGVDDGSPPVIPVNPGAQDPATDTAPLVLRGSTASSGDFTPDALITYKRYFASQQQKQQADSAAMKLMQDDLAETMSRHQALMDDVSGLRQTLAAPVPQQPTTVDPNFGETLAGLIGAIGGGRPNVATNDINAIAAARQQKAFQNTINQYNLTRENTLGELHDALQQANAQQAHEFDVNDRMSSTQAAIDAEQRKEDFEASQKELDRQIMEARLGRQINHDAATAFNNALLQRYRWGTQMSPDELAQYASQRQALIDAGVNPGMLTPAPTSMSERQRADQEREKNNATRTNAMIDQGQQRLDNQAMWRDQLGVIYGQRIQNTRDQIAQSKEYHDQQIALQQQQLARLLANDKIKQSSPQVAKQRNFVVDAIDKGLVSAQSDAAAADATYQTILNQRPTGTGLGATQKLADWNDALQQADQDRAEAHARLQSLQQSKGQYVDTQRPQVINPTTSAATIDIDSERKAAMSALQKYAGNPAAQQAVRDTFRAKTGKKL